MKKIGMGTGMEGARVRYDTAVFHPHTLSNGIVVWIQDPVIVLSERGVLIALLPGVGSHLDPAGKFGLAHYFEHLPFRGTSRRKNKTALINPVLSKGGNIGASTGQTLTQFDIKLPKDDLETAAEILRDLVFNPLVRKGDVVTEQGVIIQEHRDGIVGGRVAMEHSFGRMFRKSYAHMPVGNPEAIRAINQADLLSFHQQFYGANNTHLILGGAFSELSDAVEILDKHFGNVLPSLKTPRFPSLPEIISQAGHVQVTDHRCKDEINISYPFTQVSQTDVVTLGLLCRALSGGMDSPLFIELREKRGLAYASNFCGVLERPNFSFFTFECATSRKNFPAVREIFQKALSDLNGETITKTQHQEQVTRRINFHDPIGECFDATDNIVDYGRIVSTNDWSSIKDRLTVEQVLEWRDRILATPPLELEIVSG